MSAVLKNQVLSCPRACGVKVKSSRCDGIDLVVLEFYTGNGAPIEVVVSDLLSVELAGGILHNLKKMGGAM